MLGSISQVQVVTDWHKVYNIPGLILLLSQLRICISYKDPTDWAIPYDSNSLLHCICNLRKLIKNN